MLVGCGSDDTSAPAIDQSGSQLALGAEVYAASCASCHGADLRGTDRGPSHLSVVYEPNHHPDEAFRAAIADGARQHHWDFGPMPAVPGLSDAEVEAVIAFVRSRQELEGFEQ